jgi:hypothetical protein
MEIPAETSQRKPIALPDHAALRAIAEGVEAETGDASFAMGAQSCRGVPCSMSMPRFRSCRDFGDKPKPDTSARPHACARRLNSWIWAWRALCLSEQRLPRVIAVCE